MKDQIRSFWLPTFLTHTSGAKSTVNIMYQKAELILLQFAFAILYYVGKPADKPNSIMWGTSRQTQQNTTQGMFES